MLEQSYIDAQRVAYHQSVRDSDASTRCLLATFAYLGVPRTLLDVGCGDGHLVKLTGKMGAYAIGYDLHVDAYSMIDIDDRGNWCGYVTVSDDLREMDQLDNADMVLCWEVAEHIELQYADHLCDLLSRATDKYLLFSAATPGQTGSGHVNEQPHTYWIDKFRARGLGYMEIKTIVLRRVFTEVAPAAPWYGRNLLIFTK